MMKHRLKKFATSLLALVLVLTNVCMALPMAVVVEDASDSQGDAYLAANPTYSGGTGTSTDPYLISTADDFAAFSTAVSGGTTYSGSYFKQTANIDLSQNTDYCGITSAQWFSGTYDGNGKTITVNVTTTEDKHVFPQINGTIMNVGLEGSFTSGGSYISGFARKINTSRYLLNCYSNLTISTTNSSGTAVGFVTSVYGNVYNCYFGGKIDSSVKAKYYFSTSGSDTSVVNCYYLNPGATYSGTTATSVDADGLKTLASSLNNGRSTAATSAGVDVSTLSTWYDGDVHPTFVGTSTGEGDSGSDSGTGSDTDTDTEVGITGGGTKADPYIISSAKAFLEFCDKISSGNSYSGNYFKQTADIDLSSKSEYKGVPSGKYFSGTYDGNGKKLVMNVTTTEANSVFGGVNGTIMNLGLEGSFTSAEPYLGSFARSTTAKAIIANCYSNLTVKSSIDNSTAVGFVTSHNAGSIINCFFGGKIDDYNVNKYCFVCGIGDSAVCQDCYFLMSDSAVFDNGNYVDQGANGTNYYHVVGDAVKVTASELKNLTSTLNLGRKNVASTLGVNESEIATWYDGTSTPGFTKLELGITGTGTKEDPYIISSAKAFMEFSTAVDGGNTYSGKYLRQTDDIDLTGKKDYNGIASKKSFSGTYDGNGKKITVAINTTEDRHVFPELAGTGIIQNLGLEGSLTAKSDYLGGFVRCIRGTGAIIANCYSTLDVTTTSGVACGFASSNYGTMTNCLFAGTLTGNSKRALVSGVGDAAVFENCYYTTGSLAKDGIATLVTADELKTLASSLNKGRAAAAETVGIDVGDIALWENGTTHPEFSKSQLIEVKQDGKYLTANKGNYIAVSTESDKVASWKVDTGLTNVKYTVSDDKKSVKVYDSASDKKTGAGIVTITALSDSGVEISEPVKIQVFASKVSIPGVNMYTGLADAVDFEDSDAVSCYGWYVDENKTLGVPEMEIYFEAEGGVINDSEYCGILNNSSNFKMYNDLSGMQSDRNYSFYAQYYAGDDLTEAGFNGLSNPLSHTNYDKYTSWNEVYSDSFTVSEDGELPYLYFNFTIDTYFFIDNIYLIPHYNITYHFPDGTTKTVSYNPVKTRWPLAVSDTYTPTETYTAGNVLGSDGKYSYYSGNWSTSVDGIGSSAIKLENKDIDLYPEKLTDGVALYFVDSNSSIDLSFSENATVTDTYYAATVTGNGTKSIKITGKGYNGELEVKNASGTCLAVVYLTGSHKIRPGLNALTGTKEALDFETDLRVRSALSNNPVSIVENPYESTINKSDKVAMATSKGATAQASGNVKFGFAFDVGGTIEVDRPFRLDLLYAGDSTAIKLYRNTSSGEQDDLGITVGTPAIEAWTKYSAVTLPTTGKETTSLEIAGSTTKNSEKNIYIDDLMFIPAYNFKFYDEKGNLVDKFYYPGQTELTTFNFMLDSVTMDFNPNANFTVNGEDVAFGEKYTLKYEDLNVVVHPNSNSVLFSGDNITSVVPEGTKYTIPYPYELRGFMAEDFVKWTNKDGTREYKPGEEVFTSEIVGTTLYAVCDSTKFTRKPTNGNVVNFANDRYNNWIANYSFGNLLTRSNGQSADEKGVDFLWEKVDGASSYTLIYSKNKDLTDSVSVDTTKTTANVTGLDPLTYYYWKVVANFSDSTTTETSVWSFKTAYVAKILPKLGNFRDAGGKLTADGTQMIKSGLIYRGPAIDAWVKPYTDVYGIKAELDLRGKDEAGDRTKSPLGDDVKYKLVDGTHYFGNANSVKHYGNVAGQAVFGEEVRYFADSSNYPMYFHCAGGRDRTGMLAFIVTTLCGVSPDEAMMDYELTYLNQSVAGQDAKAYYQQNFSLMLGFREYIEALEGDSFKDKMEYYVKNMCGVTDAEIASVRANLLSDVPEELVSYEPVTLDVAQMRTDVPQGIRVASFVTDETRDNADEYGFIVSLDTSFINKNYETLTFDNTQIKKVSTTAYEEGTKDLVYCDSYDEAQSLFGDKAINDSGVYFMGICIGIPETASAYKTGIVVRPYVKVGTDYYYGTPYVKSIYDVAKAIKEECTENSTTVPEFVAKVIEICEA